MMLGLTEVSAGEVTVAGHDPVREPLAVKRRVGYLPDAVGFYDNMTARRESGLHGQLMGLARGVREARIAERWRGCASAMSPTSASPHFRAACGSGSASPS